MVIVNYYKSILLFNYLTNTYTFFINIIIKIILNYLYNEIIILFFSFSFDDMFVLEYLCYFSY